MMNGLKMFLPVLILASTVTTAHSEECLTIASDPNSSRAITLFTPGVKEVFEKVFIVELAGSSPGRAFCPPGFGGAHLESIFRQKRCLTACGFIGGRFSAS